MDKELYELQEAIRDLWFSILKAFGIIALVRKLGLIPKDWIVEREGR